MDTPVADFLAQYAASNTARLHMPGHKGRGFSLQGGAGTPLDGVFPYDITEIAGADALYEAEGILAASERNAASLYGSGVTCYSACGSTLAIQTMLALTCRPGDRLIAARNAHHSFVNACTLLDLTPEWILPEYNDAFGVSGAVTAAQVEQALERCPQARAVYLTSPDYLGCMSAVEEIAAVCRAKGKPLLVDNAHGAHLRFLPEDRHPLTLGASLCCDSAHKTLPVLTGGACLHVSQDYMLDLPADLPDREGEVRRRVKEAMGLFGTTSPSYLILLSLDLCNRYLAEQGRAEFARLTETAAGLLKRAAEKGFSPISARMDPTKLTLDGASVGWSGERLAAHFRAHGIEPEYTSDRHMVLMLSPRNTPAEIAQVERAIDGILPDAVRAEPEAPYTLPERVLSLREARFAGRESCPVEQAEGRIAAETRIQCPPGVPVVVAGERIDPATQKLLKKSGISAVSVVK